MFLNSMELFIRFSQDLADLLLKKNISLNYNYNMADPFTDFERHSALKTTAIGGITDKVNVCRLREFKASQVKT
jgi:hypothetical protein